MDLWVPPAQMKRELEVRRQHEADLQEQLVKHAAMKEYDRELKQIDPWLSLVWAPESAQEIGGLKPGRWHIMRRNATAPPSLLPLERDGQLAQPGSWIYDELRKADLWRDEVVKDRRQMEEKAERAKERRQAREREETTQELKDRIHALSPGVSMTNVGRGWNYRANSRKRR